MDLPIDRGTNLATQFNKMFQIFNLFREIERTVSGNKVLTVGVACEIVVRLTLLPAVGTVVVVLTTSAAYASLVPSARHLYKILIYCF